MLPFQEATLAMAAKYIALFSLLILVHPLTSLSSPTPKHNASFSRNLGVLYLLSPAPEQHLLGAP
jgi:hypothetical protein